MRNISTIFIALALLSASTYGQQGLIIPVVELKDRGLMGGVQNGRWIAPTKFASSMNVETEFVLVGWQGVEEGGVTLGKKKVDMADICEDYTQVEFELEQPNGVAIGSDAKWNPVPRVPKPIDPENAIYKKVVASFLKRKGIARPTVRIKEAFRVDLEGDGIEEVVLSATFYKGGLSPGAAVGDYSVVLLRKASGRVVTDHMLQGDFYLKNVRFGAPLEFHLSAIADLNGDGKMEIVTHAAYYEGSGSNAFEMRSGRPVMIKEFEIGCGV